MKYLIVIASILLANSAMGDQCQNFSVAKNRILRLANLEAYYKNASYLRALEMQDSGAYFEMDVVMGYGGNMREGRTFAKTHYKVVKATCSVEDRNVVFIEDPNN